MSLVENVASNRTEIQRIPRMNEAVEVAVVKWSHKYCSLMWGPEQQLSPLVRLTLEGWSMFLIPLKAHLSRGSSIWFPATYRSVTLFLKVFIWTWPNLPVYWHEMILITKPRTLHFLGSWPKCHKKSMNSWLIRLIAQIKHIQIQIRSKSMAVPVDGHQFNIYFDLKATWQCP